MKVTRLQDSYTIVVVATIEAPYYIQASWMRDRNIINWDEWLKVKDVIVVPDTSRFNIGDNITFYCDKTRFQIGTNDITKVSRIQSIAEGIVSAIDMPADWFKAIGINNEYVFTFNSIDDSLYFGDYFVPLKKWKGMFDAPRVMEFCITEEAVVDKLMPKKTIKITSVGTGDNTNIPVLNANSNYHYQIADKQEALNIVSTSTKLFDEFSTTFTDFIESIE